MKKLLIALLALSFVPLARAVDLGLAKEDAGQAGAFLDFAASARSLGMGRAQAAVADDASAVYWNPAGLTQLDRKNFNGLYSALQENTGFGVANLAIPTVDYGTFGLSIVSLQSSNFDKRQGGVPKGSYDESETGVLLANGFKLTNRLSLGTTFKVVSQKMDTYSSTGYGADVAGLMSFGHRVQAALVFRNLWAPQMKLRSQKEDYPRDVRLGLKYQPTKNLILASDFNQTERRGVKMALGSEWKIGDVMALRAGMNDTELTAGVGLKFGDWGLDYAFGYQQELGGIDSLGSSHRIGFTLNFGQKITDSGFSAKWQRKGQLVLELLRQQINAGKPPMSPDIQSIVQAGEDVISHQGFNKAVDLYTAQGYISFFKGEFERSVQSLGEALALDPKNEGLSKHLQMARQHMTDEQTKKVVALEMKVMRDLYGKGNFEDAMISCQKVLSFQPDNIEASAYLEDAKRRINEPIIREMKIAKSSFEQEEYLDAIKHLQNVKFLDPKNEEADSLMQSSIAALEKKSRLQYKAKKLSTDTVASKPKIFEVQPDANKSRQLYSQGLMLYSRGKLQEAVAMWERAVKLDGENTLARNAYNRGVAELQESKNP